MRFFLDNNNGYRTNNTIAVPKTQQAYIQMKEELLF